MNAREQSMHHMIGKLGVIERAFGDFAAARAIGADPGRAFRTGQFAARPGQPAVDFMGPIDFAYASHILGVLDAHTDAPGREEWAQRILAFQGDDGWFRASDAQNHGVEHATAYALGALQILLGRGHPLLAGLRPFTALSRQIEKRPSAGIAPFELDLLDRTHFWRGSHRAGGIASIVSAVAGLGLDTERYVGLADTSGWLDGWWAWFAARLDRRSGYWRLGPSLVTLAFNVLYRARHHPETAAMGGAVHLYWVSEKHGYPMPFPEEIISATAGLLRPNGLYEGEPYCIDLDGNFLIGRALSYLPEDHPIVPAARAALHTNRDAVVSWFAARNAAAWGASSHKLPGAFAAVAEADRVLQPHGEHRWRDIFETTSWL